MTAAVFLLVAVGISVLGSFVLWLRYRQRPHSVESGIDEFSRGMQALAPEAEQEPGSTRHRPGSPGRGGTATGS